MARPFDPNEEVEPVDLDRDGQHIMVDRHLAHQLYNLMANILEDYNMMNDHIDRNILDEVAGGVTMLPLVALGTRSGTVSLGYMMHMSDNINHRYLEVNVDSCSVETFSDCVTSDTELYVRLTNLCETTAQQTIEEAEVSPIILSCHKCGWSGPSTYNIMVTLIIQACCQGMSDFVTNYDDDKDEMMLVRNE